MGQTGLVGVAVGFFWSAILHAVLLVCLLSRGSGISLSADAFKAIFLAVLVVYSCQWMGTLSDKPYFGLLPTTLATAVCIWSYRRVITKEGEAYDA